MSQAAAHPVVLVAFDACALGRLEALLAAGRMPHLQALRERGSPGLLEPRPNGLHGMPWPSFLAGCGVEQHGWYAVKRWDARGMRLATALPRGRRMFWDALDPARHRIALIDLPFAERPGPDFPGLFVAGWQSHDQFESFTQPRDLGRELRRRFGRRPYGLEDVGAQSPALLRRTRAEALEAAQQIGRIAPWLLGRERWDLFAVAFGAPHRIGHYAWDLSQIDATALEESARRELESAVEDVYVACDAALGRIVEAAAPDARILVFALHGMRAESGWAERFPEILAAMHDVGPPPAGGSGTLYRLKRALPRGLVRKVTTRLPMRANLAVVPLWSRRMYDWSRVRCFPVPGGDSNSLLRLNLRGREARGIVEPGAEAEQLLARIADGLRSFRILDAGGWVVARIDRLGGEGVAAGTLPDLVVHWTDHPAFATRGVASPRYGEVCRQPGWRNASGRSGDHDALGWFVAAGPGLAQRRTSEPNDIADLAPTILGWLGVADRAGRSIPALAD